MTGAPKRGITYRKGLINGASAGYSEAEIRAETRRKELKGLIAMGLVGIFLMITAFLLLRIQ